jgi:hypothetical protein
LFAEIIIPLALPKNYTWAIPARFQAIVSPGIRVVVLLGRNKKYAGIIKKITLEKPAAFEPKENHDALKLIANEVSLKIFGKYWKADEGVVRFDSSQGELKPEWADATFQKRNSNFIRFFLEKNPGFYKGEELVCIAPISPTNLMRSAKDYILEGMAQPVHLS